MLTVSPITTSCEETSTSSTVIVRVQPPVPENNDLASIIKFAPYASQFLGEVEFELRSSAYTLFVPTNDALAMSGWPLGQSVLQANSGQGSQKLLLENHLVEKSMTFSDLVRSGSQKFATKSGIQLQVILSSVNGVPYLLLPDGGRARIQAVDLKMRGGVIHIIDRVIG